MKRESVRSNQRKPWYCRCGAEVNEIQLLPQGIEFALSLLIENQFVQRPIVAKVAHHAVKAGTQQASFFLFVLGLAQVVAAPLGNVERIRKDRAESIASGNELLRCSAVGFLMSPGRRICEFSSRKPTVRLTPMRGVLFVLPQHKRLRSLVNFVNLKIVKRRLKSLSRSHDKVTPSPHRLSALPIAGSSRQLVPHLLQCRQWANVDRLFFVASQIVAKYCGLTKCSPAMSASVASGFPSRLAMPITPRREEIVRVIGRLTLIELAQSV